MAGRSRSLRGTVTGATVALGVLATIVALVLFFFVTLLHRVDDTVDDAIESVHIVDDAQYELLQASRATDPSERAGYIRALRAELDRAGDYATSRHERRLLRYAREDVERYLSSLEGSDGDPPDHEDRLEAATRSLALLADLNLDQARRADDEVGRWDNAATVLAPLVMLVVLITVIAVVRWIRWRAFDPIASLAAVMDRFGQGQHEARADVAGATELSAMARQFNAMADRLTGQRERQLTFLAGVAHDLRNPLAALRLRLENLTTTTKEPRALRMIETATHQLDRLTRMVDDVLDAARIDAGHLELRRELCDLRRVARTVVDLYAGVSTIHRIELISPDQPCTASCDPMRIEQVITNLISNAVKYSPEGGRISIEVTLVAAEVRISVRDEGIGIDDASMGRLFEPFGRGSHRRGDLPGVGLGLSIVKRIVDAHGGHVEVVSTPGRGTRVTFGLPAVDARSEADAARPHVD